MSSSTAIVDRVAEIDSLVRSAPSSRPGPIVVASDGAEASLPALEMAKLLAASGAEIHVVSVLPPEPYVVPWTVLPVFSDEEKAARTERRREELAAQARRALGQSTATIEVPVGEPDEVIAHLARERRADLIVTGLRRHSRLDRLVLHGETPLAIARATRTPVLVVPDHLERLPRVAVVAAVLDESSTEVARRARPLLAGAERVFVVHVRETEHVFPGGAALEREDYYADLIQTSLDEVVTALALPSTASVETRVFVGHPVAELLDFAEIVGAELLVVGHRRRLFLDRLTGPAAVAERVFRGTPCAILLVPLDAAPRFAGRDDAGASGSWERESWSLQLTELARRNAGHPVRLEVDAREVGARAEAAGWTLIGLDYDESGDTLFVTIGPGRPDATGGDARLTCAIAHPVAIERHRPHDGGDVTLRVIHADGATLLTIRDGVTAAP